MRRLKIISIFLICIAGCVGQAQEDHPTVVVGPGEGEERWVLPTSAESLGEGALIQMKLDRFDVPYTNMMALTQTLATSGILVHKHTFEDELIYVVSGNGFAIAGEDRAETPLEAGSLVYIPIGEWHGVRNADPDERMEVLVVTTPANEEWVSGFFRNASVLPGHPPLNLSEEEFLALFSKYGMELPE